MNPYKTYSDYGADVFVAKFSNTGSLVYSTFLNGYAPPIDHTTLTQYTTLLLAVDSAGQLYVLKSYIGIGFHSLAWNYTVVYTINADGHIKTAQSDYDYNFTPTAFAVDSVGRLYIAGHSTNTIPETTLLGFYSSGSKFLDKTFPTYGYASAISLDAAGSIYLAGSAGSDLQTTPGAFQRNGTGAFVLKVDPLSSKVAYSTFVNGKGGPDIETISAADDGSVFVLGTAASSDVPHANAGFQPAYPGGSRAGFIFRLDTAGSALLESSFLGGSGAEAPECLHLDGAGNVFISGTTMSPNFPGEWPTGVVQEPFQYAYLTRLEPNKKSPVDLSVRGRCDSFARTNTLLTCEITVSNVGASSASNVTALIAVPTSAGVLEFVACNSTASAVCHGGGNDRSVTYANLDPGESQQIMLAYRVVLANGESKKVAVLGTVGSYTVDFAISNNAIGVSVTLNPTSTAKVTVGSTPSGLSFTVQDGYSYTTPHVFEGPTDDALIIAWTTPQAGVKGPNSQLAFSGWSDARLDNPRTVTFQNTTVIGHFKQQYLLTVSSQGSGTISKATGWQFEGEAISLNATANPCYVFDFWSGSGAGSYSGTNASITINMLGPITETAIFRPVQGPCSATASVVNAASFRSDYLAPGSIFSIFGVGLASATATAPSGAFSRWPDRIGEVQVLLNDKSVPIYYVSPGQINGQIPYDAPIGQAKLVVSVGSQSSAPISISIVPSAAGIFDIGNNRAAALNQDWSLNTPQTPGAVGSVIAVFMTGQGLVDYAIEAGAPAPQSPLIHSLLPVTATIGGRDAPVEFAGLAVGFVGLLQVNIRIPDSVPTGDQPLAIRIGNSISNAPLISIGVKALTAPSP